MKPLIPIDQCALYKCRSKKRLAALLRVDLGQLNTRNQWIGYRIDTKPKKHGGYRVIHVPEEKLKPVQHRIQHLLARIEKPEWVFSGTRGKCHIDNARYHEGSPFVITADISSFYDSCEREAVYRFFLERMDVASDVAEILSDLTTYRDRATNRCCIPTGSPCSQLIAYFAYQDMFDELHQIAVRYGCKFSLYVDDITLSSYEAISDPRSMEKMLEHTLSAFGHHLKWSKTKYRGRAQHKVVTGVALTAGNGSVSVPNNLGERVIDGMRDVKHGQLDKACSVLGQIGAARQITPGVFPEAEHVVLRTLHEAPQPHIDST